MKISPMTLTKARTLAAINGTTVHHQLKVLARRTARLQTKPTYSGSVHRVEAFSVL